MVIIEYVIKVKVDMASSEGEGRNTEEDFWQCNSMETEKEKERWTDEVNNDARLMRNLRMAALGWYVWRKLEEDVKTQ